jgi:hypothetical protein
MTTESDAILFARFPKVEFWNRPIPITSLATREVTYGCPLCMESKVETQAADEAVILKHIEEVHGLKSVASVYVSPEEAQRDCKAVSIDSLCRVSKIT